MNKFSLIAVAAAILLVSWGVTGHRAIGRIAENHLTPNAKAAVRELLGAESLADVSTWADEVRNQADYKHTGSWHFLNLPLGLSYSAFQQEVTDMKEENVYSALLQQEKALTDKSTPREKKAEALKFVVHFIGDLHQPMHISRAEDKGGNTIQVNYDGTGANLHSLWDTKLLEHEGLNYEQLAERYDHLGQEQIRQWQSDPLIKWIWESYEISSKLYAEVDAMKTRTIDEEYYKAHLPIIRERIEQAGIRLAGVLNQLFKDGPAGYPAGDKPNPSATTGNSPGAGGASAGASSSSAQKDAKAPVTIDIHDAANHLDEYVNICAKVYGYKTLESMTLVNLGAAYPDQLLTVVLRGAAKDAYDGIDGQTVCVTGKIELFKGKPEIVIKDPKQIVLTAKSK